MISFKEAYKIVLSTTRDFGVEEVVLSSGINRILRETWKADRDMPPYHRVAMDGIAIQEAGLGKRREKIKIEGLAAAGSPKMQLKNDSSCIEIMTGAVLPDGADTVIPYEHIDIESGYCRINQPFKSGQNVHRQGHDRAEGDILLKPGMKISATEIGVGASIGKSKISVSRNPNICVVSTGDELVEIDQTPLPHQIRKSNIYRICASLRNRGMEVSTMHLMDNKIELRNNIQSAINDFDVLILSGGVSKGKFDYLPEVLEELGVNKLFHRVAQRPGKPFWFGTHPDGCHVFAFPGNPVSSFMCTHVYLMPWLDACQQKQPSPAVHAILAEAVKFPKPLTYFMGVHTEINDKGQLMAYPRIGHGSGDLANLMVGNSFMQLPAEETDFEKGQIFPIIFYR